MFVAKKRDFFKAQSAEQLLRALGSARELGLPYWLLGGGRNVVISDEGLEGLVIYDANREQLAFAESAVTISSGFAWRDWWRNAAGGA